MWCYADVANYVMEDRSYWKLYKFTITTHLKYNINAVFILPKVEVKSIIKIIMIMAPFTSCNGPKQHVIALIFNENEEVLNIQYVTKRSF